VSGWIRLPARRSACAWDELLRRPLLPAGDDLSVGQPVCARLLLGFAHCHAGIRLLAVPERLHVRLWHGRHSEPAAAVSPRLLLPPAVVWWHWLPRGHIQQQHVEYHRRRLSAMPGGILLPAGHHHAVAAVPHWPLLSSWDRAGNRLALPRGHLQSEPVPHARGRVHQLSGRVLVRSRVLDHHRLQRGNVQ